MFFIAINNRNANHESLLLQNIEGLTNEYRYVNQNMEKRTQCFQLCSTVGCIKMKNYTSLSCVWARNENLMSWNKHTCY